MMLANGTEHRTVLYILGIDRLIGQEPVVHYRLEPVTITYANRRVIDCSPSCEKSSDEGTIPFKDWDKFVRCKGYLNAQREWLPICLEAQKYEESMK